ncbi:hypothetical protein Tco_0019990 [Tanacetum coccineum]
MYDDYISGQPSVAQRTAHAAPTTQNLQTLNASTITADSAPTPLNSSSQALTIPNTLQDVDELQTQPQHLRTDGEMCIYALSVSTMEPSTVKEAMTDPGWIDSMQEELL